MIEELELSERVNTIMKVFGLAYRTTSTKELQEIDNMLEKHIGAFAVHAAFGATMDWLDTVITKQKVIHKLVELSKLIDEIKDKIDLDRKHP